MHLIDFAKLFINDHAVLAYALLFIDVVLEGEIALLVSGIMVHLGIVKLSILLPVLISGAVLKTVLGYYLGVYLRRKYGEHKLFHYFERKVLALLPNFNAKPFWSIIISKFLYGINNFVLIFSGYERIKLSLFLKAEFISSIIWLGSLFVLGYVFSYAAIAVTHTISTFILTIFLFLLCFFILERLINMFVEVKEEFHHHE